MESMYMYKVFRFIEIGNYDWTEIVWQILIYNSNFIAKNCIIGENVYKIQIYSNVLFHCYFLQYANVCNMCTILYTTIVLY